MAAPNKNSVAILGQMLDEFKKQGVSQRVGTHSFGNQMRATLAALRKADEGWWSVKIRTEDRWNPAEGRIEVVVSLLEQDPGFSLVLMDLHMPILNGIAATQAIREREAVQSGSNHIPIVAMTASTSPDDHRNCIDAGMDDFLAKPVSLESLDAILKRWTPQPVPVKDGQA